MQFLEAKYNRAEERNASEDERLAILHMIDDIKTKLNVLHRQEDEKNAALAHVLEDIKQIDDSDTVRDEFTGRLETQGKDDVFDVKKDFLRDENGITSSDLSQEIICVPPEKSFDIGEESLDDDQLDLIERTNDANMLVTGPAGCGKSLIALHKAKQLLNSGHDVILIAFTKSLRAFMQQGNKNSTYFYHYWKWLKNGCPSADYIIVDEIQDFTYKEIQEFIKAAKKYYFFFGDTAQSIMTVGDRKPLSIEDLSKNLGLTPLRLYSNYRLPRAVARITQDYVGV